MYVSGGTLAHLLQKWSMHNHEIVTKKHHLIGRPVSPAQYPTPSESCQRLDWNSQKKLQFWPIQGTKSLAMKRMIQTSLLICGHNIHNLNEIFDSFF